MKPGKLRTLVGALVWASLLVMIFTAPVLRSAQAAATLDYGQAVNGNLSAGAPEVTYTFNGKTGDKIMVAMNAIGGDIDPQLALYNPAGQLIGEDDNGGGKFDALLRGIVLNADGAYRVVAQNRRKADGQYSLMVTFDKARLPGYFEGAPTKESFQLSKPWPRNSLTYYIANALPGFSMQDTRAVIAEAFGAWSAVVPLTFTEVNTNNSDIHIQFSQIDGEANVLGQACPPTSSCSGEVEFDADEQWTLRQPHGYSDISFLAVATHEFGHIIGLLHSNDTSALMYAAYSPYNLKPARDDVAGAQRLYKAGTGRVNGNGGTTTTNGNATTVRATINNDQFVTYWDFDVSAGESATISMKRVSGNLDAFLVLLDANNRILAYADDSAGMDAILKNVRFPQTGTYTVAATRYKQAQGYTTGDYELTIAYGQ
jgi:hypothetical protein